MHGSSNEAANFAEVLANQINPNIVYALLSSPAEFRNRDAQSPTYSAKLAWQAYKRLDLDLENDQGAVKLYPEIQAVISPDDLYYSQTVAKSMLVQQKSSNAQMPKIVYRIFSPADLLVTDADGKRTGHNPATGTTFDEIPGAHYTGPDAEPETITMLANSKPMTLSVMGTEAGEYRLEIVSFTSNQIISKTVKLTTGEGANDQFTVTPAPATGEGLFVQIPEDEERSMYLPMLERQD